MKKPETSDSTHDPYMLLGEKDNSNRHFPFPPLELKAQLLITIMLKHLTLNERT